ncbi:hypothetical protein ACFPA8_23300 [Streptomyces ovatisporus]|uniref:Uncharacterized protein n=1 Tax=Streptomyces ovatisporus TaxID=1128682 RepID=A0ABV9ADX1_9ACTN
MSEPMPGPIPAQYDGGPAAPVEAAETTQPAPPAPPRQEVPLPAAPAAEHADDQAGPGTAAEAGPGPDGTEGRYDSREGDESGEPDDGPRPLGLRTEPTGHSPVDARLRRLEDADHLAVSGHLEVYEDVHRGLRDTLTALDRPAPGPAPAPRVPGHPHPGS